MLTVKHVHGDDAHKIWQTRWVSASEPARQHVDHDRVVMFMCEPDLTHITISHGSVYVMNDSGNTVQQYHLADDKLTSDSVGGPAEMQAA